MAQDRLHKKDFTKLYNLHHKQVYDFVLRRVSTKEIAEDLTSEIFEKILKTIETFQWQGITVSAWIFRIARNHLIDYYRKNDKRKSDSSFDDIVDIVISPTTSAQEELEKSEDEIHLFKSIMELNEEEQYIVYYKFYEEMSNKQIAELTNTTETNIGTKLHRIRKKLATLVKKNENTKQSDSKIK